MSMLAAAILAAAMPVGSVTPKGFHLAAETRNFVFYTRDGAKVDAAKNQRFLDEVAVKLGARVDDKKAYYRYQWSEELAFVLGPAAASASGAYMATGDIHSTKEHDQHEIVHRAAFAIGDPGALFQEGLAVELGDQGRFGKAKVDELARGASGQVAFRTLADRFLSVAPEVRYPLAGSFVKFLIAQHGLAKVSEFFRGCPNERARDARFAQVFGVTLDAAGSAWITALAR
jgi:hypothetical protein